MVALCYFEHLWESNLCMATHKHASGAQGRPKKRWEDDLNEFAVSKMSRSEVLAQNQVMWDSLEDEYVAWDSEDVSEKLD